MQHEKHKDDYEGLIIEKKSLEKVLFDIDEVDDPIQEEKQQLQKEHNFFWENKYEYNNLLEYITTLLYC